MMAETLIDRSVSISARAEIIPTVNKPVDALCGFSRSVSRALIDAALLGTRRTLGGDNVSLALAAFKFDPRKLYTNTGSDYLTDANLFALIRNQTD